MYSYFILILSIALCLADVEAITGKKVRAANQNEFPFVVSIGWKVPKRTAQENHFCTGILISRVHVLTAAHCFIANAKAKHVRVTFGTVDLSTKRNYVNVFSWITFDEWATLNDNVIQFGQNDIAMLTLSNPILQENIEPVKLSPLNNRQIERTDGILAGFGRLDNGEKTRFLQTANVTVLSREACTEKIRKYLTKRIRYLEKEICSAADPSILVSRGDSGGPVLNIRGELVGVIIGSCPSVTWYQEPGAAEFLKKYKINARASVDFYREFIEYFQRD